MTPAEAIAKLRALEQDALPAWTARSDLGATWALDVHASSGARGPLVSVALNCRYPDLVATGRNALPALLRIAGLVLEHECPEDATCAMCSALAALAKAVQP